MEGGEVCGRGSSLEGEEGHGRGSRVKGVQRLVCMGCKGAQSFKHMGRKGAIQGSKVRTA